MSTLLGVDVLFHEALTRAILGCAIEVHRALGPGLLESAYEECLCQELEDRSLSFRRQVGFPVIYKGKQLRCCYRLDLVVAEAVVVELKAVERTLPLHEAQLLTYLRMSGFRVGLLINWNAPRLIDGVVRRVV